MCKVAEEVVLMVIVGTLERRRLLGRESDNNIWKVPPRATTTHKEIL
jgi:hypothetical protein